MLVIIAAAPPYSALWQSIPAYRELGTWMFAWRRPAPDGSDRVLVLLDRPGEDAEVRAAYPDRALYRLLRTQQPPYMRVVEASDGAPPSQTP